VTTVASRKAKGRKLQDWVRDQLMEAFKLNDDHIRSAIMGETGADVKLSRVALKKFPYKIECKNQEVYKRLYTDFAQAKSHTGKDEPLLIVKMNRHPPLVIMDAAHFIQLAKDYYDRKNPRTTA
jgi:hypothetical protein